MNVRQSLPSANISRSGPTPGSVPRISRQLSFLLLILIFLSAGLLSCATPSPTQTPQAPILEQPESRWLHDALSRRQAQSDPAPREPLVQLGILASGAVNLANNRDPATLSFGDDPEKNASHAKSVLEPVWEVFSRQDLLSTLDNLAYTKGFPGLYRRVLDILLDHPQEMGQPNRFLEEGFWDSYLEEQPDAASDIGALDFILRNHSFMTLSSFSVFELGRLSSLVRWGYAAGYLTEEETRLLMEDIGLSLAATPWDFPLLAHAQLVGIGILYRGSNNLQVATTTRGIEVWRLLQGGEWQAEYWDAAREQARTLLETGERSLPDFFPRFTRDLPPLPEGIKISQDIQALFNPDEKPESLIPYYRKDFDLYHAIADNDLSTVDSLLRRYQYIDAPAVDGYSWTHHAVPNSQALKLLLEAGFDPNVKNSYNYNALFRATQEKNLESMRLLIEHGAEVQVSHARNSSTPLTVSISRDFLEGLKLLLKHGADPNAGYINDDPPLGYAIARRDTEFALALLQYGADPEQKDSDGWPPLHLAVQYGSPTLVQAVIDRGVDPDSRAANGTPAIITAAASDQLENVQVLIKAGADPDLRSNGGYPVLHTYINSKHFDIWDARDSDTRYDPVENFAPDLERYIELFPQQRSLTAGDKRRSLIWFLRAYASEERFIEEVEYLKQEAPELLENIPPGNQYSIAHSLIRRGLRQAFQEFAPHISAQGMAHRLENGYHILYYALTDPDSYWAADVLLDQGADPDLPGYKDYTPIIAVLDDGQIMKAMELVERGADINQLNTYTDEPLFTTFLTNLKQADIPLEEKKELIFRAMDHGAELLNYQDYPRQYWYMPYFQFFSGDFHEIMPDVARYYLDTGKRLGSQFVEEQILTGSNMVLYPDHLIALTRVHQDGDDSAGYLYWKDQVRVDYSVDWEPSQEDQAVILQVEIHADDLDTETMVLLDSSRRPEVLPDTLPIRITIPLKSIGKTSNGTLILSKTLVFEAAGQEYLARITVEKAPTPGTSTAQ